LKEKMSWQLRHILVGLKLNLNIQKKHAALKEAEVEKKTMEYE